MRSSSLDWPLSQEEKKSRLVLLYDKDVEAADYLLREYAKRLKAEREPSFQADSSPRQCEPSLPVKATSKEEEGESALAWKGNGLLHLAAAAFGVFLGGQAAEPGSGVGGCSDEWAGQEPSSPSRLRARSEGANCTQLQPALRRSGCMTPRKRLSRGGEPLRVTFADGKRSPGADSEQDCFADKIQAAAPAEARRSSLTEPQPEQEPQPENVSPPADDAHPALVGEPEGGSWLTLPLTSSFFEPMQRGRSLAAEEVSRGQNSCSPGRLLRAAEEDEEGEEVNRKREVRRAKLRGRLHGYSDGM
eukprot:TRINITY_DN83257_c0_g1_i1.p1 TRINITY_DN83257_c0_g1~~TRINITY_DN83257_c0_g1_i1.p1  ORF type:complete len:303 (+),score=83.24 TRINITY_DN83257_c0_g1_i1:49-957(+)